MVPRGRNAKGTRVIGSLKLKHFLYFRNPIGRKGKSTMPGNGKEPDSAGPSSPRASSSASSTCGALDDNHWSKDDKYDAESYLEINYKKHLTRHANK